MRHTMLDDPDSDTELLSHGGSSKIVSYYSELANNGSVVDDDDDDDDDVNFDVISFRTKRKGKRPRGRPPKKVSQPPQKKVATAEKTPKTVFEISDDDEVVTVTARENLDQGDLDARLAAERARSVLAESTRDNTDLEEAIRLQEEARIERETALRIKQEAERRAQEKQRRENTKFEAIVFKARHGEQLKKIRMRTTDPLRRLLPKFCRDFGLDSSKVYLEFDGEEVGPNDTPQTVELEQDMIVDVYVRGSRK